MFPCRTRWTTQKLITEGDEEANIAHYCLQELHLIPSAFLSLSRKESLYHRLLRSTRRRRKETAEGSRTKAQKEVTPFGDHSDSDFPL